MFDSWEPMDCSPLGSSVHGIFRQEYWSDGNGVKPFPSSGDLPDPGAEPTSALQAVSYTVGEFFTAELLGKLGSYGSSTFKFFKKTPQWVRKTLI